MKSLKSLAIRLLIVGIIAVFPAMLIALALPAVITAATVVGGIDQPTVIDLSGPKTVRTCPAGMELKTITDTRPNYNRTGTITNVEYTCEGPNGAKAMPTETYEPASNPPPRLEDQVFFFSPAADWMRLLAYPVSFVLVFIVSLFVKTSN